MTRPSARTFVIACIALAVLFGAAAGTYALQLGPWRDDPEPLALGPVIARVNGDPIHLMEARTRVEGLSTVHDGVEEMLGEDWPAQILQSLVDDQILRQEAATLGVTVTDEDIASYVYRIEGMLGEDQTLDQWLAEQGMTLPELERRVELQIIGARIYITVTEDVVVTGAEVRDYYRDHRLEYTGADGTVQSLLELRQSLREGLLKEKQDEAYAAWLTESRERAEVVVVMDDWWRNV
ncbi:MAG: SurA N-terminal domain-containing protein [Actinomycetota bacterium]